MTLTIFKPRLAGGEGLESFYAQARTEVTKVTPKIRAVLDGAGIEYRESHSVETIEGVAIEVVKFTLVGGAGPLAKAAVRLRERLKVEMTIDPLHMVLNPKPAGEFSAATRELMVSSHAVVELRPDHILGHEIRHAWHHEFLEQRKPSAFHTWVVGEGDPPKDRGN